MNSTIHAKCPFCQSDAKSLWPEVKVCQCKSCDLLFRYPVPALKELEVLYQTSWDDPTNQIDETGATSLDLSQMYIRGIANSLGRKDLKGLRILDYGAGRGAMLRSLMNAGVDAYGVEPFGFEFLRQNGYKAFRSMDELPQGLVFDGIVSLDVVEHVNTPWESYGKLKEFLTETGWLYLATPNAAGINAQYYRAKWREIANRGHLYFFTPTTLELTLEKSGYYKIRRLQWFIDYRKGPILKSLHWLLQFLRMDGELRYLALV
jgi:2-polyprenyl-3-methyl-5-hydroxy-6-metoxy-1,4-benzoquinol methylase